MHSKATGSMSHRVMNLCLSDEYIVKSRTWDSDLKYTQGWEKSIINVYLIYFTLCKLLEIRPLEPLAEGSAQVHPGPIDMLNRFDIRMIIFINVCLSICLNVVGFSYSTFRICVLQSIPIVEIPSKTISKLFVLDTSSLQWLKYRKLHLTETQYFHMKRTIEELIFASIE